MGRSGRQRLSSGDVGAWLLKSRALPDAVSPGWAAQTQVVLSRCVTRSYRLDLMVPGQPCVLWVSGQRDPGVHAVGHLVDRPDLPLREHGEPTVRVALTRLGRHVPRADLVRDAEGADAEVLRMPAGSNPSYLTPGQYAALLALAGPHRG